MGPFNLPSDEALHYPTFTSFQEREDYIRQQLRESPQFLERIDDERDQMDGRVENFYENEEHGMPQNILDRTEGDSYRMERGEGHAGISEDLNLLDRGQEIGPSNSYSPSRREDPGAYLENVQDVAASGYHSPPRLRPFRRQRRVTLPEPPYPPVSLRSPPRPAWRRQPLLEFNRRRLPSPRSYEAEQIPPGLREISTGVEQFPQMSSLEPEPEPDSSDFSESSTSSGTTDDIPELDLDSLDSRNLSPVMSAEESVEHASTVLVGDKYSGDIFEPRRGDLVVAHPGTRRRLNSIGYLGTRLQLDALEPTDPNHPNRLKPGNLVLRIGVYKEAAEGVFVYKPYRKLELYMYYPMYTGRGDYIFLGSQAEMVNTDIPVDNSPGKHLQIGARATTLVPRRGDVIIKAGAWIENYDHTANFRRSMVKWHRDASPNWTLDDMLIRLFVDKSKDPNQYIYRERVRARRAHGHAPPFPGFAELYRFEGARLGWVFWGRTQHVVDTPYEDDPLLLERFRFYVADDGRHSDPEVEEINTTMEDDPGFFPNFRGRFFR